MDTAKVLADLDLTAPAVTDHVAKALQVYEVVMKVYAASEVRYQAAIQAACPVNGFASSTNGPAH
jgi:predicted fused transcriptional regulator/phosphomethylpyrimidine kinase